jgi:hypothetical protein
VTATNAPMFTRSGLPGIDQVPVGMHACHFYADRGELVAALVPYCIAGLRGNERCLLVTAPPLPASEAIQELRAAWVGIDEAIQTGALRVLDFDQWYASSGGLKGLQVVQLWLEEEERALAEGYSGLRIAGNTSFLTPEDWATFMEYEEAVSAHLSSRRIVALCSYALAVCNDVRMNEVIRTHHCGLERTKANWRVVPNGEVDLTESGEDHQAVHPDQAATAPNGSYRCYFTDTDDRIKSFEQIECNDDAEAALKAQALLAGSRFTSSELWQGSRLVGKWSQVATSQRPDAIMRADLQR